MLAVIIIRELMYSLFISFHFEVVTFLFGGNVGRIDALIGFRLEIKLSCHSGPSFVPAE